MKNHEIFELRNTLNELVNVKGKSFAYAIYKNMEALDKEIELINKVKKETPQEFIDYENERTLLCIKYSDKDDDGNPLIVQVNGTPSYKITNTDKFEKEFSKVKDKYAQVLVDKRESDAEFDKFLDSDNDVVLKKVSIEDLPDDITASFIDKIKHMLS